MTSSIIAFASVASFSCRNCARTTEFEQPPCRDGHGADCPEWYCTQCGAATIVGRDFIADSRGADALADQPLARAISRS